MKTVRVDPIMCTACMLCVDSLPAVFEMSADGVATAVNPAGAPESDIQECIDNCPSEAISWADG